MIVKLSYYALYKGDELLTVGTIKELAEYLGCNEQSVRHYSTPAHKRRSKGKSYAVYKLSEDNEE